MKLLIIWVFCLGFCLWCLSMPKPDRLMTFNTDQAVFSWDGRDGKHYVIDFKDRTMTDGSLKKKFSQTEQLRMLHFFGLMQSYADESEDWYPDPEKYEERFAPPAQNQRRGSVD